MNFSRCSCKDKHICECVNTCLSVHAGAVSRIPEGSGRFPVKSPSLRSRALTDGGAEAELTPLIKLNVLLLQLISELEFLHTSLFSSVNATFISSLSSPHSRGDSQILTLRRKRRYARSTSPTLHNQPMLSVPVQVQDSPGQEHLISSGPLQEAASVAPLGNAPHAAAAW